MLHGAGKDEWLLCPSYHSIPRQGKPSYGGQAPEQSRHAKSYQADRGGSICGGTDPAGLALAGSLLSLAIVRPMGKELFFFSSHAALTGADILNGKVPVSEIGCAACVKEGVI